MASLLALPHELLANVAHRLPATGRVASAHACHSLRAAVADVGADVGVDVDVFCVQAAGDGAVSLLAWGLERHFPARPVACAAAAAAGHLGALKILLAHGCDWDAEVYAAGVRGGHVDLVRWACEHGCPIRSLPGPLLHPRAAGEGAHHLRTTDLPPALQAWAAPRTAALRKAHAGGVWYDGVYAAPCPTRTGRVRRGFHALYATPGECIQTLAGHAGDLTLAATMVAIAQADPRLRGRVRMHAWLLRTVAAPATCGAWLAEM